MKKKNHTLNLFCVVNFKKIYGLSLIIYFHMQQESLHLKNPITQTISIVKTINI